MNLVAHGTVLAPDGILVGHLSGVTVDADTSQVADLVVMPQGRLPIVVPVVAVGEIRDDVVWLSMPVAACTRSIGMLSSEALLASSKVALAKQSSIQPLDFGATVAALDGELGLLRRILYDEYSRDVEGLVIALPGAPQRDVAVPMDWVLRIRRGRVVLDCNREDVLTMPPAPEDR